MLSQLSYNNPVIAGGPARAAWSGSRFTAARAAFAARALSAAREARGRTWSLAGLIAPDDRRRPTLAARFAVFAVLFIPWLVLYSTIVNLGPGHNAFETYFLGELHWPVYQWAELLYASPYVLVTIVPLVVRTNRLLRRFTLVGILGTVIGHVVFLIIPAMATPRLFEPHGVLGRMMLLERYLDGNGAGALPSFHVFWVFLGAAALGSTWRPWRHVFELWAVAVALSCVFTGVHSTLDIIAGFALYLLTWFHEPLWQWLKRAETPLGDVATPMFIELAWNGLLVAVTLHLARHAVPARVVLTLYPLLWLLSRLAQQAIEFTEPRLIDSGAVRGELKVESV